MDTTLDEALRLIGGIDDVAPMVFDEGGALLNSAGRWQLQWLVGAPENQRAGETSPHETVSSVTGEASWLDPISQASLRQRRETYGPIFETMIRVGDGDVVSIAYPALVARRQAVAFEFRNDGSAPVGLRLRIGGPDLSSAEVSAAEGKVEFALSSGDALEFLFESEPVETVDSIKRTEGDEGGFVELTWALLHRGSLKMVLVDGNGRSGPLGRVPEPDEVARGWKAIIERATRYDSGDPNLDLRSGQARASLLLARHVDSTRVRSAAPEVGPILDALGLGGHFFEAAEILRGLVGQYPLELSHGFGAAYNLVAGAVRAAMLLDDPSLSVELLEPLEAYQVLLKRSHDQRLYHSAQRLLHLFQANTLGSPRSVELLRQLLNGLPVKLEVVTIDTASSGETSDRDQSSEGQMPVAQYVRAQHQRFSRELECSEGYVVELFADSIGAGGVNAELHDANTLFGSVSAALRWHGERPALLWELRPNTAGRLLLAEGLLQMGVKTTDGWWFSSEESGETMFATR